MQWDIMLLGLLLLAAALPAAGRLRVAVRADSDDKAATGGPLLAGGKPPLPVPAVLQMPWAPPPLRPLHRVPNLRVEWLPTLGPAPTTVAPPLPPTAPPPPAEWVAAQAKPEIPYVLGNMYAAKDVTGGWQIVRLTRGPDRDGHYAGDVFANVTAGLPAAKNASTWPVIFGSPEFLRATPPPPPEGLPRALLWPRSASGQPGELIRIPGRAILPDRRYTLSGGPWPLRWTASGPGAPYAAAPAPAPAQAPSLASPGAGGGLPPPPGGA